MITGVLSTLCVVFLIATIAIAIAWKKVAFQLSDCKISLSERSAELDRFSAISNIDAYKKECELATIESKKIYERHVNATKTLKIQEASLTSELEHLRSIVGEFKSANELRDHVGSLNAKKASIKKEVKGYQRVIADFKTAKDLNDHVKHLRLLVGNFKNANEIQTQVKLLLGQVGEQKRLLATYSDAINDARTAQEIKAKTTYYQNLVSQLEEDVDELTEAKQLQEFAFYRPRFDFDKSAEYRRRLDDNRAKQKDLLKSERATNCEIEWEVSGSRAKGRQMEKQKIKLMLRAFNGECDAAIAKATYRNVESLGKRIQRAFSAINKLSSVDRIEILQPYLDLKNDELHLAYEWEVKKQEEKEEQARIKEQMREEKKIADEVEKSQKLAEKEEKERQKELDRNEEALANAKAELESARSKLEIEGDQLKGVANELKERAAQLQAEHDSLVASVKEATERKAKAIARAQLTRSGHVYVLSNIGSFGEDCFKIGLSRRLEPLERVKELGSASVPFPFDVHAMIYSEDAPSLETKLHRHFADRKVNRVNGRKEFFHIELNEIMEAVSEYHGKVTFVLNAEAADYRQSVNQLREEGKSHLLPHSSKRQESVRETNPRTQTSYVT